MCALPSYTHFHNVQSCYIHLWSILRMFKGWSKASWSHSTLHTWYCESCKRKKLIPGICNILSKRFETVLQSQFTVFFNCYCHRLSPVILTRFIISRLGAHAQRGFSSWFVCLWVRVCRGLFWHHMLRGYLLAIPAASELREPEMLKGDFPETTAFAVKSRDLIRSLRPVYFRGSGTHNEWHVSTPSCYLPA